MLRTRLGVLAAGLLLSALAGATVIITPGPGNFPGDEEVQFNSGSLIQTGPLVQGITNQTNSIVDFDMAAEDLTTPSAGQARVEAVDGNYTSLRLRLDDPNRSFHTLIWNINAIQDGTVTFTVVHTGGPDLVQSFAVGSAGENFFRFEATDETMTSVSLLCDAQIADVRQIRIGGVVPEPTAMLALAVGGIGLLARKRRKA